MQSIADLERRLLEIDGRGYKSYKGTAGLYRLKDGSILYIDYVQGDPFASPSRLRLRIPQQVSRIPAEMFSTQVREIACRDFLTRSFAREVRENAKGRRGTGKSGMIAIDNPGQEILERTSMVITRDYVEARFVAGFPARGRRILGQKAREMLIEEIPEIGRKSLCAQNIDLRRLAQHVELAEDQEFIRSELHRQGLVAFVADGAILPRESGISDRPMKRSRAVFFKSPQALRVELSLPNRGTITGMGVKEGVTLIAGGGYHGKSTLLRAIERGVYNHIPGDGREYVITRNDAVKIRAEDGRRVEKVDISAFISNLPFDQDTVKFSTGEASGSTSQAANIMEALEARAGLLLLDEDTSATNFMIRDVRMQALVSKDREPITPFIDKVKLLYKDLGVSTILVIGGSGDYFDVADTIIAMKAYIPEDVTEQAYSISREFETRRRREGGERFGEVRNRVPSRKGLEARKGRKVKVGARGRSVIQYGRENIDLGAVEQLVDEGQTRAIADFIYYSSRKYIDGRRDLYSVVEAVFQDIREQGLDVISLFYGQNPGDYAMPRRFEVMAAFNRLRTFTVEG